MKHLRCALGPLFVSHSPYTYILPHEHLLLDLSPWWSGVEPFGSVVEDDGLTPEGVIAARRDPLGSVRENLVLSDWVGLARELSVAKEAGLRVVVDLTSEGLRPDRSAALRAAATAKVEVMFGVGQYREPIFTREARAESADQRAERWLGIWKDGFGDGSVPGIIGEIGTSSVISSDERKSLIAAATASCETGAAISVHVEPFAQTEQEILRILIGAGAKPSRIILSHIDVEYDEEKLKRLAEENIFIEFDQFGFPPEGLDRGRPIPNDTDRLRMIDLLISSGAEDRILLSHDVCTRNQWACWGGGGFAHIGTRVQPKLIRTFGEDLAEKLLWHNAVEALAI